MYSQIRNISIACIILVALGGFFQTATADTEANKQLVFRHMELWDTGNLAIADEIFATDYINHDPTLPDVTDIEGLKGSVIASRIAFPDFHHTSEDMVAEGDKVVRRVTINATHQGEFMGIPATGRQVTWTGIIMSRIADDKILDEWWSYDALALMQQLDVMPPTREDYTWGEPSTVTGDPGDPVTNTAFVLYVVQKFWNEQNVTALDNTHSLEFIAHNPVIPGHPLPYDMYKDVCLLHLAAFPDLRVTTENIIAEGDKVAIRWTVNGTHQGELMGIPATGIPVTFTGMTIYRFADGKIVENWWAYDALGMMQQITTPPESEPQQE